MTDFEKAVRYLCFPDTDDDVTVMVNRYRDIEKMATGDDKLIEKYKERYEKYAKMLDFLCRL